MKHVKWSVLFLFVSKAAAFMSQTYSIAEVSAYNASLTGSIGVESFNYEFFEENSGTAASLQITGCYTAKGYERVAAIGHIGALGGNDVEELSIGVVPYAEIGLQFEFVENPSIAVQLSAGFPSFISLTLLGGINSRKTNREIVTLGLKTFIIYPTIFVAVHPTSRLHLSAGASYIYPGLMFYGGEVHVGIAYTFLDKSERRSK